jgi:hypothetical protein
MSGAGSTLLEVNGQGAAGPERPGPQGQERTR